MIEVEKAWFYFEQARQNGMRLDVETYNAILRVVNFVQEGHEQCWELLTVLAFFTLA